MKVLIVGAGIAGLSLAIGLKRQGFEPHLYERRSRSDFAEGLFLTITANGLRALNELGLLDAVLEKHTYPTPRLRFLGSTGKRLGTVSNGWLDGTYPSFTIFHRDLRAALEAVAIQLGIDVTYNADLASCRWLDDRVQATFAEGETIGGDLLVGADGIGSRVRPYVVGTDHYPLPVGLTNVGGELSASWCSSTPGTMNLLWGRRAFFGYHVDRTGHAIWFANVPNHVVGATARSSEKLQHTLRTQLALLFRDDTEIAGAMIRNTEAILTYPIEELPPLPTWVHGRIVLIGDAAHAVSPSTGQGASLALEDALALTSCLVEEESVRAALDRFQRLRMPRTERIHALGRQWSRPKVLESRFAAWSRELFMPWILRLTANRESMRWLHDYSVAES